MKITKQYLVEVIKQEMNSILQEGRKGDYPVRNKNGNWVSALTGENWAAVMKRRRDASTQQGRRDRAARAAELARMPNEPESGDKEPPVKEASKVMQEMGSAGPSLDHVERGPLAPDAKPEYVGQAGSYYVYKFGYLFGAYKAAPEHNFYGVFWKNQVDDKSNKVPEPPQKYMIKDLGDEKAKQLAMDYAAGNIPYVPSKPRTYNAERSREINVGIYGGQPKHRRSR